MIRLSLRARVMASFAAGALLLSATMAILSYDLTRRTLLASRERSAIRAAYFDATVVHGGLATDRPDVVEVLRSLDTGSSRRPVLRRDGDWYAKTADGGYTAAIPEELQQLVASGQPAVQRVHTGTGAAIVVGIPLADATQFYVVDSLEELERSLRVLALVITLVAAGTTAAGAITAAIMQRITTTISICSAPRAWISLPCLWSTIPPPTQRF